MDSNFNDRNNTENRENINRAEELNKALFSTVSEGVGEFSDPYAKVLEYTEPVPNGGFDDDELRKPSPVRRMWKAVTAWVLCVTMGFFGAVVGIYALSQSGFTDSSSMLGNLLIDASGLEINKVTVNETELTYTGGFIETSERILQSIVVIKEYTLNNAGTGYVENGAASGVIISADGYIVTNQHVTVEVDKLGVVLYDGTAYVAEIVGTDEITDIALLKVELPEGVSLVPATLGVSANVKCGQSVIAAGNPMGVGHSVSIGIVSATDRESVTDGEVNRVIQTDAALSPGNSGGGLFDVYGNLIGIIYSKTMWNGAEGLGYAVPIDTVKTVVNDLLKYSYVKGRAALGVSVYSVFTSSTYNELRQGDFAEYLFDSRYGIYIAEALYEGSQFKRGDLLVMIEDERVTSGDMITEKLRERNPGDKMKVTVERMTEDPNDGNAVERLDLIIELCERDW